jgi:hypothetical protein
MKICNFALAAVALTIAAPAEAEEDASGGVPVGIPIAMPDAGAEAGYLFTPLITVRAGAPFLKLEQRIAPGAAGEDGRARLRSGLLLADMFPSRSGFHISGGLRFRRNKAWALGTPTARATYLINGRTYSAGEVGTHRADTTPSSAAPLVMIGYGGALSRRLAFGVEAGALLHGSAMANRLTITGSCANPVPAPYCGTMGADLDAERLGVHRDISQYRVYPLVQLRMGYRF